MTNGRQDYEPNGAVQRMLRALALGVLLPLHLVADVARGRRQRRYVR
jgi:hypothetical protein